MNSDVGWYKSNTNLYHVNTSQLISRALSLNECCYTSPFSLAAAVMLVGNIIHRDYKLQSLHIEVLAYTCC